MGDDLNHKSVGELKHIIASAGLTYSDCVEKADLRRRAIEALGGGARVDQREEEEIPAADPEPDAAEKEELALNWTTEALRIQLRCLSLPDGGSKAELVDTYWCPPARAACDVSPVLRAPRREHGPIARVMHAAGGARRVHSASRGPPRQPPLGAMIASRVAAGAISSPRDRNAMSTRGDGCAWAGCPTPIRRARSSALCRDSR